MRFKGKTGWVLGLLCIIPACVFLKGYTYKLFMDFHEHGQNESPCACHKCLLDDDPWFMARFDKSIDPFLTRKSNLSKDAYKWWKLIQYDKYAKDFSYGAVVEKLFNFFPDNVVFMDSSPTRCRTCAVVGNSGTLNGSNYGALIDTHDVIIRMNRAHVKGYEVDVGSQTTLHVMYPESAIDLDNSTYLVLFAYKVTDLRWLVSAFTTGTITSTYQPVKAKIKANKDLVMVLSPAFMKYVHEIWLDKKGSYPSTGFMALMLGMHICDEVNVFGFGADKYGNWNHYWEILKNKNLKTGVHGGMNEYKLISQLSDKQKIHFFKGW